MCTYPFSSVPNGQLTGDLFLIWQVSQEIGLTNAQFTEFKKNSNLLFGIHVCTYTIPFVFQNVSNYWKEYQKRKHTFFNKCYSYCHHTTEKWKCVSRRHIECWRIMENADNSVGRNSFFFCQLLSLLFWNVKCYSESPLPPTILLSSTLSFKSFKWIW